MSQIPNGVIVLVEYGVLLVVLNLVPLDENVIDDSWLDRSSVFLDGGLEFETFRYIWVEHLVFIYNNFD